MADKALDALHDEFDRMYSHTGRPSVPPEVILKSLLLQVLYSVRNNRLLVEKLGYNILYLLVALRSIPELAEVVLGREG